MMEDQLLLPCPLCAYKAITSEDLEAHKAMSHSPAKRLHCKISNCASTFESKRELNSHLVTQHEHYQCPFKRCSKVFRYKNRLEKHFPTHGTVAPLPSDHTLSVDSASLEASKADLDPANVAQLATETFGYLQNVFELANKDQNPAESLKNFWSGMLLGVLQDSAASLPMSLYMQAAEAAFNCHLPPVSSPPPLPEAQDHVHSPVHSSGASGSTQPEAKREELEMDISSPEVEDTDLNVSASSEKDQISPSEEGDKAAPVATPETKRRPTKRKRENSFQKVPGEGKSLITGGSSDPFGVIRPPKRRGPKPTVHKCDVCNTVLPYKADLRQHMSTEHGGRRQHQTSFQVQELSLAPPEVTQPVQGAAIPETGELQDQVQTAESPTDLICIDVNCNLHFKNSAELFDHVQKAHDL